MVVVGDEVEFDINEDGTGVISEVGERKNYISRKAPRIKGAGHRGERLEQIIASNVDMLYVVSSIFSPQLNERTIDRLIVAAESSHVSVSIILNKCDLSDEKETNFWRDFYSQLGYDVFVTSVTENIGINEVRASLEGKVNLFWGSSGVGKSSILNSLFPELDFNVGEISDASDKGKHTTVTSVMNQVLEGTYVIDTPGIREIDPYGIKKEDLGHYFKEFEDYIHDCKFNTCTHQHEPGCAVIEAVDEEEIDIIRYKSYLNLLETIEEDMNF